MKLSYGDGGWVRLDDDTMPGPVYLRYRDDSGRPVLTEFYLDGRGSEIPSGLFRKMDLAGLTAWGMRGHGDWLESSPQQAGPDLSRLASHFAMNYGAGTFAGRHCGECNAPLRRSAPSPLGEQALTDWVALSWFSQFPKSSIPRPKRGDAGVSKHQVERTAPDPVKPPDGLTDDFLRSVADNYAWAVSLRERPAPMIAAQCGCPVRTVRSWIMKARKRGILAPTTRGKVG